jgi:hypothetical protein
VGGVGPRFLLEAAFLIALAVGVGVAELSAGAIVGVMAAAWLLISLFELTVWAEGPRFPTVRRRTEIVEEPDEVTPAETVEPAAVTEIREPEPQPRRRRFWRRRRAVSGERV